MKSKLNQSISLLSYLFLIITIVSCQKESTKSVNNSSANANTANLATSNKRGLDSVKGLYIMGYCGVGRVPSPYIDNQTIVLPVGVLLASPDYGPIIPTNIIPPSSRTFAGGYTLVLQGDGNLVIYPPNNKTHGIWDSGTWSKTNNHRQCTLELQTDGNLVIYERQNGKRVAIWAHNQLFCASMLNYGVKPVLALQSDANVVELYPIPGSVKWGDVGATGTNGGHASAWNNQFK